MEIERKFLVQGEYKPLAIAKHAIKQGYLSKDPERTVRIRIKDELAFITIKGKSSKSGMSRFEWEKEIPVAEAEELLKLCLPAVIEKTRYIIPEYSGLIFEVDEFYGLHKGLVLAEIELPSESHTFVYPDWLGQEVTGLPQYYNSYLSSNPMRQK